MSDNLKYNPYKANSFEGGVQIWLLNVIDRALQANPHVSRAEMTARAMARRRWLTPELVNRANAWSAQQARDYERYLQSQSGSAMLADYERSLQSRFGPAMQSTKEPGPSNGSGFAGGSSGLQTLPAESNATYTDTLDHLRIANTGRNVPQALTPTIQRPATAPSLGSVNTTGTSIAPANRPLPGNTDASPSQTQNNLAATGPVPQRLDALSNGQVLNDPSFASPLQFTFDSTANSALQSSYGLSGWLDLFLGIPGFREEDFYEALNESYGYDRDPDSGPSIQSSEGHQAVADNHGTGEAARDTDGGHQTEQDTAGEHEAEQGADDGAKAGAKAEAVRGKEPSHTEIDLELEEHPGDVKRASSRMPAPRGRGRVGEEVTGGTVGVDGAATYAADTSEGMIALATGGEAGGHVVGRGDGRQSEEVQISTTTTTITGNRIVYDNIDDEHNIEEDEDGKFRLMLSDEGINKMFHP